VASPICGEGPGERTAGVASGEGKGGRAGVLSGWGKDRLTQKARRKGEKPAPFKPEGLRIAKNERWGRGEGGRRRGGACLYSARERITWRERGRKLLLDEEGEGRTL